MGIGKVNPFVWVVLLVIALIIGLVWFAIHANEYSEREALRFSDAIYVRSLEKALGHGGWFIESTVTIGGSEQVKFAFPARNKDSFPSSAVFSEAYEQILMYWDKDSMIVIHDPELYQSSSGKKYKVIRFKKPLSHIS